MAYIHPAWVEHRRKYWMRENAHLWIRPDADRYLRPDWRDRKYWVDPPALRGQDRAAARSDYGASAVTEAAMVRELKAFQRELHQLRWLLADLKLHLMLRRLQRKYRPDQPRVPAGNTDGGQWTSEGGGQNDSRVISDATPDIAWIPGAQYAQGGTQRRYSVDLKEEDARGGHTIEKHVGRTDAELLSVLRQNYHVGIVYYEYQDAEGSFTSRESANEFVNRVLEDNKATVDLVASGRKDGATLERRFGYVTGKEAFRPSVDSEPYVRNTYAVRVRIQHDLRSERGYRVLTAFPINFRRR
ncbi:MAG: RNase A-like domain-containing protein [Bradyrhizobium sp.]